MRSGFLKALVLLSLAVILLGMPLLLTPHRIRPSTFALIKHGMTLAEVEELLGAPPGRYDGYSYGFANISDSRTWTDEWNARTKAWASRHGGVEIRFDEESRVFWWNEYPPAPATWWARVLDRILPQRRVPPLSTPW